ncbi:MAG: Ribosomal large subunit pseudouridine synthase C [Chlamydiae bacterium]|nr:Ribosomal large subunit pseudouridine synthase C [Chlamydiota bacterium]
MKLEELYEDNHLLCLNKPSGLLTQPTSYTQDSLETRAKQWIKERDQKRSVFLHAVHRLDKDTSGVVMFAKSQKALSRMTKAFRERKVKKTYLAITQKIPKTKTLKHTLKHGSHKALQDASGKESHLSFEVLKKQKGLYLLEIDLETGRYHQIRAQFALEECPIVGDHKYGSPLDVSLALHCFSLVFLHPTTQKELKIQAPFPKQSLWNLF